VHGGVRVKLFPAVAAVTLNAAPAKLECDARNEQCLNCEKRSGGTLEARCQRRLDERRRRENRGTVGVEGEGNGEGVSPLQPTSGSGGAS